MSPKYSLKGFLCLSKPFKNQNFSLCRLNTRYPLATSSAHLTFSVKRTHYVRLKSLPKYIISRVFQWPLWFLLLVCFHSFPLPYMCMPLLKLSAIVINMISLLLGNSSMSNGTLARSKTKSPRKALEGYQIPDDNIRVARKYHRNYHWKFGCSKCGSLQNERWGVRRYEELPRLCPKSFNLLALNHFREFYRLVSNLHAFKWRNLNEIRKS